MASSGIRRKVDDLGRVVIPAGIRRTLGIREGDPVEVTVEGERVVLAKPQDACVFCGREEEELTGFRGRLVCRDCLGSLGSVDERLRTTAAADARAPQPATPPAAALPDWDAPPRPTGRGPMPDTRPRPGTGSTPGTAAPASRPTDPAEVSARAMPASPPPAVARTSTESTSGARPPAPEAAEPAPGTPTRIEPPTTARPPSGAPDGHEPPSANDHHGWDPEQHRWARERQRDERDEPRTPRRPPYDPASTTAW